MTRFFNLQTPLSILLWGSLSFCSAFLQAATLTVSDNLIVSEIDDKSIKNGFFGNKLSFELGQGPHVLIVRYKDVFEDLEFAQDTVVESKKFVVKFTITDEQRLSLSTIEIKNLASAQSFSIMPELNLKNEHNKPLNIELEKVADYKLAKQVSLAVTTQASKQTINKSPAKVSAVITEKNTVSQVIDIEKQSNNTLTQVNSLAMLKYWWRNASDDEKLYFKKHIKINN